MSATTVGRLRPRLRRAALLAAVLGAVAPAARPAAGGARFITLASTTSTRDSGLFDFILPRFEARTGIEVRVVAVGTGRAIRLAERGDADVLLVHDAESERRFVAEGFGRERREVMYNDFVIAGPPGDPAGIRGRHDAARALLRIADARALFASRGDQSGTHKAELRLWAVAGFDPSGHSGTWYRETGAGMGATLNTAAELGAYLLADRGSWLSFRNRRRLTLLVEGDPRLRNPYGVMLVDPKRHPHVRSEDGQAFVDWLVSDAGQTAIGEFRVDGQVLFVPSAVRPSGAPD